MDWLTDREKRDRQSMKSTPKVSKLTTIGAFIFSICLTTLICTPAVIASLSGVTWMEAAQSFTEFPYFLAGIPLGLCLAVLGSN
jgi:hypothetical protein